jgi:hypothetical protein
MPPQIPHLIYLGVIARQDCSEYGFRITNEDKTARLLILTIANSVFLTKQLMVQEAPDLCYQRALADLNNPTTDPIEDLISITESDIAKYRAFHPYAAARRKAFTKSAG